MIGNISHGLVGKDILLDLEHNVIASVLHCVMAIMLLEHRGGFRSRQKAGLGRR